MSRGASAAALFTAVFGLGRASQPAFEPEALPVPPPSVRIDVIQRLNVEIARCDADADEDTPEDMLLELDLAFGRYLTAKAAGDSEGLLDALAYVTVSAITAGLLTRGDTFNDALDDNVDELRGAIDESEVQEDLAEQADQGC